MRLEATSLPAGILDCVEPVERRFDLREGDLILMVSDGVPTEEPWVEEQLAAWDGEDPTELCRRIAEAARLRCRVKTGRYYGGGPATEKKIKLRLLICIAKGAAQ